MVCILSSIESLFFDILLFGTTIYTLFHTTIFLVYV